MPLPPAAAARVNELIAEAHMLRSRGKMRDAVINYDLVRAQLASDM